MSLASLRLDGCSKVNHNEGIAKWEVVDRNGGFVTAKGGREISSGRRGRFGTIEVCHGGPDYSLLILLIFIKTVQPRRTFKYPGAA